MRVRNAQKRKKTLRGMRHRRVRAKVSGTAARPRLTVFRSAKHVSAQVIDDAAARTLVSASDRDLKSRPTDGGKVAVAEAVGKLIAERAHAKGIESVTFDRGGYSYHGRVKAVADGARAGGLKF